MRKNKERAFLVPKDLVKVRVATILQHKLRLVMACYTIVAFKIEEDGWFSFKKTHKKRGVQFIDHNVWWGKYEIKEMEGNDKEVILNISVNGTPGVK